MKKFIIILVIAILAGGCVHRSAYHPKKNGVGYSERREDQIRVVEFYGRLDSTIEESGDFASLRAAEITIKNGQEYFGIVNIKSETTTTDSGAYVPPAPTPAPAPPAYVPPYNSNMPYPIYLPTWEQTHPGTTRGLNALAEGLARGMVNANRYHDKPHTQLFFVCQ